MLPEWYFCCCIGIDDRKTSAFLSLLDVLEDEEAEDILLARTYAELRRTETWMQIYASQHVLRSLHHKKQEVIGLQVQQYLNNLLELLPDETTRSTFRSLITTLMKTGTNQVNNLELIEHLENCAAHTINQLHLSDRAPAERPYLDLEIFLPETLLLMTLIDQYANQVGFSLVLNEAMEKKTHLQMMLKDALAYQYGRLAFLLAVRLAPHLLDDYMERKEEVARLIWLAPGSAATYEPDLLAATVQVLYIDTILLTDEDDVDNVRKCTWRLINESLSMWQWRRLEEYREKHRQFSQEMYNQRVKEALGRVDLTASEQVVPLPYVLWQLTLWDAAAHFDPATTAKQLSYQWLSPGALAARGETIEVSRPNYREYPDRYTEDNKEWSECLKALATLQISSDLPELTINLVPSKGPYPSISPKPWLFFSPWLGFSSKPGQLHYERAPECAPLIRLLVAAVTAIRLIKQPPEALSTNERSIFAALIVHADHVLSQTFGNWLTRRKVGSGQRSLSPAMTGLANFCAGAIRNVGQGYFQRVPPTWFLDIGSSEVDEKISTRQNLPQYFREIVLPQVLFQWISGAYMTANAIRPSSIKEARREERWLQLISKVHTLSDWAHDDRYPRGAKSQAALILRFLAGIPIPIESQNWRNTPDRRWSKFKAGQVLLLPPEQDASSWSTPDWDEPDWQSLEVSDEEALTRFVLATQRLAALRESDPLINEETRKRWLQNWRFCMNSSSAKPFNRFARLRLLELLDKPALANSAEDQQLIALTILERGNVYKLSELIRRLYWRPDQAISTDHFAPSNDARRVVRSSFLKALFRYVYSAGGRQEEDEEQQEEQKEVETPREMLYRSRKKSFLLRALLYLIWAIRIQEDTDNAELKDALETLLQEREQPHYRAVRAEAISYGAKRRIVLPQQAELRDWMLAGASYDPNALQYTLYYEHFETDGLLNFFETPSKITQFMRDRQQPIQRVVGVIVGENQDKNTPDQASYVLNCGLPRYIETPFAPKQNDRLTVGAFISAAVSWQGPELRTEPDLRILPRARSKETARTIGLYEAWTESGYSVRCRFRPEENYQPVNWQKWGWKWWFADISRPFRTASPWEERTVSVRIMPDGSLRPMEQDLLQMLLQGQTHTRDHVFVLTFIGEPKTDDTTGEQSWLFSIRPGENYRLSESAFWPGDLERLKSELARRVDSTGLLVVVKPSFNRQLNVCLELVTPSQNDAARELQTELQQRYERLVLPFDSRNCTWRTLFDPEEKKDFKARYKPGLGWVVDLDEDDQNVSGFPTEIKVSWVKGAPDERGSEAILNSPCWDQNRSWLGLTDKPPTAAAYPNLEITPASPDLEDWKNFMERWTTLKKNDVLKLDSVLTFLATSGDGHVFCLTDENVGVQVEAESLTMNLIDTQIRLQLEGQRLAQIYWDPDWLARDLSLDSAPDAEVPAAAFKDNQCVGFLISVPSRPNNSTCKVLWQTYDADGCQICSLDIRNFQGLGIREFKDLARQLPLGTQLHGQRTPSGSYQFTAYTRRIRARALWTIHEWNDYHCEQLLYLGKINYQGQERFIAEDIRRGKVGTGDLVLLPPVSENIAPCTEIRLTDDGTVLANNISPSIHFSSYCNRKPYNGFYRLVLTQENRVLVGLNDRPWMSLAMRLEGFRLQIETADTRGVITRPGTHLHRESVSPSTAYVFLKRYFVLDDMAPWRSAYEKPATDERTLKEELRSCQDERVPLKGTIRLVNGRRCIELEEMLVPTHPSLRVGTQLKAWDRFALLVDGETPDVVDATPTSEAWVCLQPDPDHDQHIQASFRLVPPMKPADYFSSRPGFTVGKKIELSPTPLYYVGEETIEPEDSASIHEHASSERAMAGTVQDPSSANRSFYRFELAPGRTLIVPKEHLEFYGRPFSDKHMPLYHGDEVTVIIFKEISPTLLKSEPEIDQEAMPVYGIDIVGFAFSQAHTLYKQSEARVVHVLHLLLIRNTIRINYIEGFAERRDDDNKELFTRVRSNLRLNPESEQYLRGRMHTTGRPQLCVLARLNKDIFIGTNGRIVQFDHVRFSFYATNEGGFPLEDGELVFVEGERITQRENETLLFLKPHPDIDPEDVDNELSRHLAIQRRHFSVRANLLDRLYEENEQRFEKRMLIRITRSSNQPNRIICSIVKVNDGTPYLPARDPRAMRFHEQSNDLFAVWIRQIETDESDVDGTKSDKVFLELSQPGVFVALSSSEVQLSAELSPTDIPPGCIVRVQRHMKDNHVQYQITPASFSDDRYIPPRASRLVVAFPKNDMFRSSVFEQNDVNHDDFWRANRFAIGGLPNIVAGADIDDYSHRITRTASDFIKLMEHPYPKIVFLRRSGSLNLIAPAPESVDVGALEFNEADESCTVFFAPQRQDDLLRQQLIWRYLSFSDTSAKQLMSRAGQETWRYRDAGTVYWSEQQAIIPQAVPECSSRKGPLFFEPVFSGQQGNLLHLRYRADRFRQYGFPVSELVNSLKNAGTKEYTIAGVSEGHPWSLWLELAPGRIVELPTQLIVRLAQGREQRLANLNWHTFAPGDTIKLALFADDPLKIERFVFVRWQPGLRASFGAAGLLSSATYQAEQGALQIGEGAFTLTLPFDQTEYQELFAQANSQSAVILYPNNVLDVTDDPGNLLQTGTTVLLGLRRQENTFRGERLTREELTILGMPGWFPTLDRAVQPNRTLHEPTQNLIMLLRRRLEDVIRVAGGTLPVTVESFNPAKRQIYFSIRLQQEAASLQPGSVVPARLLGIVTRVLGSDLEDAALLRVGGGLIALPMSKLVSGLPSTHRTVATEVLTQLDIWLRCDDQGVIECGLDAERGILDAEHSINISVRALNAIALEDGREPGLLCESLHTSRLYWLPANRAAWMPLTREQLEMVFSRSTPPFKVRLKEKYPLHYRYASITDTHEVRRDWEQLVIGQRFHVRIIHEMKDRPADGKRYYLAQHLSNRMAVCCVVHDKKGFPSDQWQGIKVGGKAVAVELTERLFVTDDKDAQPLVVVTPYGKKPLKLDLPLWRPPLIPLTPPRRFDRSEGARLLSQYDQVFRNKDIGDVQLENLLACAYNDISHHLVSEIACEWIERHEKEAEMKVAPALMTIILLDKLGENNIQQGIPANSPSLANLRFLGREYQEKALLLARNLGRRALRSGHVEVIALQWLHNKEYADRRVGAWKRLQELRKYLLEDKLATQHIDDIKAFCQSVRWRGITEYPLLSISESLGAAVGQIADFAHIMDLTREERNFITRNLITVYKSLPTPRAFSTREQQRLHECHVRLLQDTLRQMLRREIDLILLDQLPELRYE